MHSCTTATLTILFLMIQYSPAVSIDDDNYSYLPDVSTDIENHPFEVGYLLISNLLVKRPPQSAEKYQETQQETQQETRQETEKNLDTPHANAPPRNGVHTVRNIKTNEVQNHYTDYESMIQKIGFEVQNILTILMPVLNQTMTGDNLRVVTNFWLAAYVTTWVGILMLTYIFYWIINSILDFILNITKVVIKLVWFISSIILVLWMDKHMTLQKGDKWVRFMIVLFVLLMSSVLYCKLKKGIQYIWNYFFGDGTTERV